MQKKTNTLTSFNHNVLYLNDELRNAVLNGYDTTIIVIDQLKTFNFLRF